MQNTDNIIHRFSIYRQSGIRMIPKRLQNLLYTILRINCDHIYPVCQNLFHIYIIKLNRGTKQLTLVLIEHAFLLNLIDHRHQLFFCHTLFLSDMYDLSKKFFPCAKDDIEWRQDYH